MRGLPSRERGEHRLLDLSSLAARAYSISPAGSAGVAGVPRNFCFSAPQVNGATGVDPSVTVSEMEGYMKEGHFAPGSMGPKVRAMISFLSSGGKRGLITSAGKLADALEGRVGTHFVGGY